MCVCVYMCVYVKKLLLFIYIEVEPLFSQLYSSKCISISMTETIILEMYGFVVWAVAPITSA